MLIVIIFFYKCKIFLQVLSRGPNSLFLQYATWRPRPASLTQRAALNSTTVPTRKPVGEIPRWKNVNTRSYLMRRPCDASTSAPQSVEGGSNQRINVSTVESIHNVGVLLFWKHAKIWKLHKPQIYKKQWAVFVRVDKTTNCQFCSSGK